jgi:ribosomal protein L20A (L18A)
MAKEVSVFRIEYDMEKSNWQASIAAFSQEEAVKQLYRLFPNKNNIKKINSISMECKLDAVSDEVRKDLLHEAYIKIDKMAKEIESLKKAKDLRTIPKK